MIFAYWWFHPKLLMFMRRTKKYFCPGPKIGALGPISKLLIWPVTVFLRKSRLALRKAPQLGHFLTNWPQFFCKWKLRTISSWYLVISDRLFDIGAEILALSEKNPDIKIPVFSGGKTLTAWAFGPITQKIFDPKPFSVGHIGPNLSLHTPFTPLPNTFLVILVKRITLKKNLPPPTSAK